MNQLHFFPFDIRPDELPEKFTFPFNYEPHPLCCAAADQVQAYLKDSLNELGHDFRIEKEPDGRVTGKMFGVLVVQDETSGKIGFLASFSGKLGGKNAHSYFVPPVYDLLAAEGFFVREYDEIFSINEEIRELEKFQPWKVNADQLEFLKKSASEAVEEKREIVRAGKKRRQEQRRKLEGVCSEEEYLKSCEVFAAESEKERWAFKKERKKWQEIIDEQQKTVASSMEHYQALKQKRIHLSNLLQEKIFEHYSFLNFRGKHKSLNEIFEPAPGEFPPSGAGECAAPKLLQYAYLNGLRPLCMAEFWWGQSPRSEIRKHGYFYPSCRGKCEPILGHMLSGLEVERNPMLERMERQMKAHKGLDIVFEDEYLVVVNKPSEFLSVPGTQYTDSVQERLKLLYPADDLLLVHRLDMSTSGLLIAGKSKKVYVDLQRQFTERTVKKRYEAILDGTPEFEKREIRLPLRPDLNDRPRQMVCFQHGKEAVTIAEKREVREGKTRVYLYPVTGRTHQLRVHVSHPSGLNCPIEGDDLYGKRSGRLCLHAGYLEVTHPVTGKRMIFEIPADF